MRVKLFLHGHLKEKVGKDFVETEAKSAYEALSSLATKFRGVLKAPLDVGRWKVVVRDYETKEKLMGSIRHNVLHIYPVFRTAKNAWVSVVIGAVMVAAVLLTGGAAAMGLGAMGASLGGFALGAVGWAGVAIMLSGIMTLMAPKISTSQEQKTNSKYLGTIGNTTAAGTRIPFGYGLYKVSGHFISYNVSSTTVRVIDTTSGA